MKHEKIRFFFLQLNLENPGLIKVFQDVNFLPAALTIKD